MKSRETETAGITFGKQLRKSRGKLTREIVRAVRRNRRTLDRALACIARNYAGQKKDALYDGITVMLPEVSAKLRDIPAVETCIPVYGVRGTTYTAREAEAIALVSGLERTFTKKRISLVWIDKAIGNKASNEMKPVSLADVLAGAYDLAVIIRPADYGISEPKMVSGVLSDAELAEAIVEVEW